MSKPIESLQSFFSVVSGWHGHLKPNQATEENNFSLFFSKTQSKGWWSWGETESRERDEDKLWSLTFGTVLSDPSRVTLTRAVNRVAGAIVGAHTRLSAAFTKLSTWTHCVDTHTHTHTNKYSYLLWQLLVLIKVQKYSVKSESFCKELASKLMPVLLKGY